MSALANVASVRSEEAAEAALMLESLTLMPLQRGSLLARRCWGWPLEGGAEEAVILPAAEVLGEPMMMAAVGEALAVRKARQTMEAEGLGCLVRMLIGWMTAFESSAAEAASCLREVADPSTTRSSVAVVPRYVVSS